ncbi:unnamed protein product [Spirodela intermedia]|uniref:Uncharacterized protein n=2 Tax=Spirodela intermedia TaxID=51605 RepID=A0A7I8JV35_SPIIN|nr:unnamed protein product [Spirodela intermedia]CAA6673625.1 unnamed protein product [Spirodela intermedia]CAA7410867.1 unnamed protein product [Spirodela intermedia]
MEKEKKLVFIKAYIDGELMVAMVDIKATCNFMALKKIHQLEVTLTKTTIKFKVVD